jgi:gliding motility-associated-like protein
MRIRTLYILLLFILYYSSLRAQSADFSANFIQGCDNLVVSFTNLSTGASSYQWNFGDGSVVSGDVSPTHYYANPGIYTVSLTAIGTGSDTETKESYIKVYKSPAVNFTANVTSGCVPLVVQFENTTTIGSIGIANWFWDFGDGVNSTDAMPSHIYSVAGTPDVSLFATDSNGCNDEVMKVDFINAIVNNLNAEFTIDKANSCEIPHTISITNTSSGSINSYNWNFGNGSSSSDQNPDPQSYNEFGTFVVSLNVSGANGCADSLKQNITITPFSTDFSIDTTKGCQPFTAQFTDLSVGATFWNWDFGDAGTSTNKNPSHLYASSGTYTVRLISGNANCSDTITKVFEIIVFPKPTVLFTASDSSACEVPFDVNFTCNNSGINSWNWNFGNGITSTSENPDVTYITPGNYNVSLSITDTNNCTNFFSKPQYIKIVLPVANFSFDIVKGCKPLDVNFTDLSTSVEEMEHWYWNFGDESSIVDMQNPLHTFLDTGVFSIQLIIENASGCRDTVIITDAIKVGDHKPVNFSPLDTAGCYKLPVPFTDLSGSVTDEWLWDFGDGGTSTLQNPSHTYADTGFFNVSLIAGFHGCYDTLVVDSVVEVWPPIARFVADNLIGCDTPFVVTFTDNSVVADVWRWEFGDGQVFNGQTPPPHSYTDIQFYDVWLYVQNTTTGCMDSTSMQVKISDIRVGFYPDTISGCQPFSAHFNDTSYVNTVKTAWQWSFGDGGTSVQQHPTYVYTQGGFYDVKLIVTDQLGCSDSLFKPALIDVKQIPNVGFVTDTTNGCVPLTINFSDTSTAIVPLIAWAWNYGDSNNGTGINSTHTYNSRGVYSVSLTVTDENNCSGTANMNNLITATKPYPNFTVPAVSCNHQAVNFTNTSTGTTSSDVLTYSWVFGDGSSSTEISPSHAYHTTLTSSVSYDIILSVVDQNGCDSSITKSTALSIPISNFGATETNATCPPFYVQFKDSSYSDPGTITAWYWDFGDNTDPLTQQNPTHPYFNAGTFGVTLIVTDSYGCKDTLERNPFIDINGPVGTIEYSIDNTTTCIPIVTFIANSENAVSQFWIFDDGKLGVGDTVTHSYYVPGSYNPVLILQDALGCQDEIELEEAITVTFPIVDIELSSTNAICTSHTGTATVTASGGTSPYTYSWNNGQTTSTAINLALGYHTVLVLDELECPGYDSVMVQSTNQTFNNSFTKTDEICISSAATATAIPSGGNAPYTFSWENADTEATATQLAEGSYTITITDSYGCVKTDEVSIQRVWNTFLPNISHLDVVCTNTEGTATANPSNGNPPYTYQWSTGNYSSSIIHLAPGTYYVTITDSYGCVAQDSATIIAADNNSIQSIFVADTNNVLAVVPIHFTSNSVDSLPIISYTWIIDNETLTDTIGTLSYRFESSGNYPVYLIIEDLYGCVDTSSLVITIKDGLEVPNVFTPNGDGINDYFYVQDSGIESYEFEVYNRWGAIIFKETAPKVYWTGRTVAGVLVPSGTYYYLIRATSVLGNKFEYKGFITLIRE